MSDSTIYTLQTLITHGKYLITKFMITEEQFINICSIVSQASTLIAYGKPTKQECNYLNKQLKELDKAILPEFPGEKHEIKKT